MKVAKWGNSLAIRLPANLVVALGLSEGDEVEVRVGNGDGLLVRKDMSHDEIRKRLAEFRSSRGLKLPGGFRMVRAELHDRSKRQRG